MKVKDTKKSITQAGLEANEDFYNLLKSFNISEDKMNDFANSKEYEDLCGVVEDDSNVNYALKISNIHGRGIFSNDRFIKNQIIGFAFKNNKRTYLAKYTNHSHLYNAVFVDFNNKSTILMLATKEIQVGEEILVDYRNQILNRAKYNIN